MEGAQSIALVVAIEFVVSEFIIPGRTFGLGFGAIGAYIVIAVPIRIASSNARFNQSVFANNIAV